MDYEEFFELKDNVLKKIGTQLEIKNRTDELESYLKTIDCYEFIDASTKSNTNIIMESAKILVFGASMVNEDDLKMCAKKLCINPKKLEFHTDYKKNKHYDFRSLKDNLYYSDIIFGPLAHKGVGMGDHSNPISMMRADSERYPKVIEIANSSGEFKITRNSFSEALQKTNLYKYLIL